MEFKFKGVPAIIAAVALGLGALGYRVFLHSTFSSDPKLRQQLERNLQYEIARDISNDTKAIKEAMERGDKAEASKIAEQTLERSVDIKDLGMRGTGEDIVIKAVYSVNGPEGAQERTSYFKYSHSPITGWRYRHKTTSMSWYLRVL